MLSFLTVGQQQSFIENKGQWPEDFDFRYTFGNGSVFLNETSLTVNLIDPESLSGGDHRLIPAEQAGEREDKVINAHAYRVHFIGADSNCDKSGGEKQTVYHNYIIGKDPERWKSEVPLYKEVTYHNIYPHIDLRYYFSMEGNLKYDFILHPGADVSQIKLRYEGADDLELVYGNLMVRTSVEDVLESAPYSYQQLKDGKTKVDCNYELNGNVVTFNLKRFRKNETVIIDPKLVFSSYSGSTSDNFGFTATPGSDGSLYAGGLVFIGSGTYPLTTGAYQLAKGGGVTDIGISKFSPDGSQLIYSTYLGGAGDELPHSLYERADGTLVILGSSGSLNFPTTSNAYQEDLKQGIAGPTYFSDDHLISFPNGVDAVVCILDQTGGNLVGSTYFGGSFQDGLNIDVTENYGDQFRGEIVADNSGNVYFVSSTFSNDLDTTANAAQVKWGGRQDGFACSLNSDLSALIWNTYIGGQQNDNALGIKLGNQEDVFIAGGTRSANLSFGNNSYQANGIGDLDGYVLRLSRNNGSFMAGTYNGTSQEDMNFLVEVDDSGAVYVMGQTRGEYPVDTAMTYANYGSAQFIHKFSSDLTTSLRSTVFGDGTHSKCNISPTAFMVDECRNVYVSGWGGENNVDDQGYTYDLPVTENAIQTTTDGSDFYLFVLDATWKKLNYGSYFGGTDHEHVDGGTSRFAKDGTIYQAVCGGCNGSFPTTAGAYSRVNGSSRCNLAALKIDFEALEVVAEVATDKDSSCIPYTASLTNLSYNADKYIWIKPDGTKVNQNITSALINSKGSHLYTLVAIDTTCGFRDTTTLDLYGFKDTVFASFELDYDSCSNNFQVQTINTSLDADYYLWDFGDGKTSSLKSPLHGYANEGTYTIKLFTRNSYCQLVDSAFASVKFKKRINTADFKIDYEPCRNGTKATFSAYGTGFQEYKWDFGDGQKGTGSSVTHDFKKSGAYTVRLSLSDTLCQRYLEKDTLMEIYASGYEPVFPNVFTPNGDGQNERFGLSPDVPRNYFSAFYMQVYNRWGTLLYESSNVDEPWDGSFEGNEMAEGVYFYIVNLKDGCEVEKEYKGFVHLLNRK